MDYWYGLDNVTIQFNMSNSEFIRLLDWVHKEAGDTVTFGAVKR